MAGGIDALRLFGGAVIHPDDDIAIRLFAGADGQRRVILTDYHQRAGGVEADTGNRVRRDGGFFDRAFNAVANRLPNFVAGLFHHAAGAAEEGDLPGGVGQ